MLSIQTRSFAFSWSVETFLCSRAEGADQNGIYLATTRENVPSLTPVFENAEIQFLKGDKVWIFLAESKDNFEEYAIRACELIAARYRRIGR